MSRPQSPTSRPRRRRDLLAFTLALTATGATWLLILRDAQGYRERGDPAVLVQWLHGFAVALPLVALAVALALRVVPSLIPDRAARTRAATVATVGFAAGVALALGASVQAWLFGGVDSLQIPVALELVRDALVAVAVAVPVCGALELLRTRRPRPAREDEPVPAAAERRASRRAFLGYGAVAAAGGAAFASGRFFPSAASAAGAVSVDLYINEGYVRMVDGTPAFMRSFGLRSNNGFGKPGPRIPGPAIGPGGDQPIGRVACVTEGDSVTVRVTNALADVHTFTIPDVVDPVPIAAGATATVTFIAPPAGTYFYQDVLPAQSLLGLHGVMVVMPRDGSNTPYGNGRTDPPSPTFQYQYVWVLADVDPVWGELARQRKPIDIPTFLPRYFLINGVSGQESTENPRTVPDRRLGESSLIRMVNMGAATHSPHFHGNHVYVLTSNRGAFHVPNPAGTGSVAIAPEKDVIRMEPDSVTDVLLPVHIPLDQFPPYDPANAPTNLYPMHCHAEMSQTAGGGSYPSGMLTDWILRTDRPPLKAV
jgi:FtsP/CotA-like multicopper oxidase with cupredoxin domain